MRTEEILALGMIGRGSRIGDRIEALLQRAAGSTASPARIAAGIIAMLCVLAAGSLAPRWIAFAQQPLRFEVASIKPTPAGTRPYGWSYPPGGRFSAHNISLKTLILVAYHIQPFQLSEGPKSLQADGFDQADRPGTQGYDIEAKASGEATRGQVNQMLQSLLADRFMLKLRRETRQFSGYALVIGKNGHKLGSPTGGSALDKNFQGGGCRVKAEKTSMPDLAEYISGVVGGRPVWDRTGLEGRYNFSFTCTPEVVRMANQNQPDRSAESGERAPDGPSIFQAVEDRLGLKLEPTKAPLDYFVIESAEKPDAN